MKFQKRKIFLTLITIFIVHVLIIIITGLSCRAKKSDLIIVLGNKVEESGIPSKRLQYRLNKSYELFQAGLAPIIIVSGGIGKEGFDEAEIMATYLIEKGIPKERIIRDNQGVTTYASALNSRSIMTQNNTHSIIIVSQYFHLLRSKIAFEKMGIQQVSLEHAGWFFEWRDVYSIPREIAGIYYYLFRSYDEK